MENNRKYLITCDRYKYRTCQSFCMLVSAKNMKEARKKFDSIVWTPSGRITDWHPFHIKVNRFDGELICENVFFAYKPN